MCREAGSVCLAGVTNQKFCGVETGVVGGEDLILVYG
jgi:hypothetical protein